jgi:PIN domain nuclease of toxin-antitoxin system
MVMLYVTDTHSILWHMTDDIKLSKEAKEVFKKTDSGLDYIHVPCIVFFELLFLVEKKKPINVDFDEFVKMVSSSRNYRVEPLCVPIIEKSRKIPRRRISDPWDRLIAATSLHLRLPLITRDKSLRKMGLDTIW